jgi:hypothetical protein
VNKEKVEIEVTEGFTSEMESFCEKTSLNLNALVIQAVQNFMENYPWTAPGDVCVHNERCMHWKSVEAWMEEQG